MVVGKQSLTVYVKPYPHVLCIKQIDFTVHVHSMKIDFSFFQLFIEL